jgi:hypothetical protein
MPGLPNRSTSHRKKALPPAALSFFPDKIKLDVRGASRSGTLPSP